MFLRSYVVVRRPFAQVEADMATGTQSWVPDLAVHANGDGEKLLSELGFRIGRRRIGRRIKVDIGAPRQSAGVMLLPISWHAATGAGLFPTLEGELEVAALSGEMTQLALSAVYEPPLGMIGEVADKALFHRVAEVTVKDFLDRISERLEHPHRASGDGAPTSRGRSPSSR